MSLTVGEVLENAEYNLSNGVLAIQKQIAQEQLSNYRVAKQLGADDEDNWYDWEDKVSEFRSTNN